MQWDVIVDVTSQVTSNVAADIAQPVLDIVAEKMNDKFIHCRASCIRKNAIKRPYDGELSSG